MRRRRVGRIPEEVIFKQCRIDSETSTTAKGGGGGDTIKADVRGEMRPLTANSREIARSSLEKGCHEGS